jgi:hypothetical protein
LKNAEQRVEKLIQRGNDVKIEPLGQDDGA